MPLSVLAVALVVVLLVTVTPLLPSGDRRRVLDKGEKVSSWYSEGGLKVGLKRLLFLFSLLLLFPKLVDVETLLMRRGFFTSSGVFSGGQFPFRDLYSIGDRDLFVAVMYIVLLFVLTATRLQYHITGKGIYYGIFPFSVISFYAWEEVVCYDLKGDGGRYTLSIWFRPPCFSPNWRIEVPKEKATQMSNYIRLRAPHFDRFKNSSRACYRKEV